MTCRYAHAAVTQILYQRVELHRVRAIEIFCGTILQGRTSLRSIPQSLWIGPAHYGRHPEFVHLVPRLRKALNLLSNLRALTFTPTAKSFGEIYDSLREPPFKLESFAAPYHINPSFVQFLQNQPSIETLRLHDLDTEPPRSVSIVKHINDLSSHGTLLPKLKLLAADPRVLSTLVINRPVSHVEISVGSCFSGPEEALRDLVKALARTSVPLVSLKHNLGNLRIHFWGTKFLHQLKTTDIQFTLKSLWIYLPGVMRPVFRTSSGIGPMGAHISRTFGSQLDGFTCLSSFELSLGGFTLSDPSPKEIAEVFGDAGKLET
ncbi:unnamed protein product [Rhizoctonia solani]|uniref:Uncharacterized protein n=1 Tax=Rhizoctonia solani TaxID=456999 RepID=A0A8H3DW90_9AGAM|nr:unnamed protein product [Rhizoctonia solani]